MSWTGAGIGAAIGTIFGGPLGGGVGAVIGHFVSGNDDEKDGYKVVCPHCNADLNIKNEGVIWNCENCGRSFVAIENLPSENDLLTYFYLSTFGLIAKMAKIDGVVSQSEAKVVSSVLDRFCSNKEEREISKSFYNEVKNDSNSIEYYAELLYSIAMEDYEIIKSVYYALFEVAAADGGLEEVEKDALLRVLNILKIEKTFYDYLYDDLIGNALSLSKYYEILGVSENNTNEEIKSAYRKKVKEFHPDKIISKDLPEAFIRFANEQMNLITEAYDQIRKVRGF